MSESTILKINYSDSIVLSSTLNYKYSLQWAWVQRWHKTQHSKYIWFIRLLIWNNLPAEVFPVGYNIEKFKSNVHKRYSLFPLSCNLFPQTCTMYCMSRGHSLSASYTKKNVISNTCVSNYMLASPEDVCWVLIIFIILPEAKKGYFQKQKKFNLMLLHFITRILNSCAALWVILI